MPKLDPFGSGRQMLFQPKGVKDEERETDRDRGAVRAGAIGSSSDGMGSTVPEGAPVASEGGERRGSSSPISQLQAEIRERLTLVPLSPRQREVVRCYSLGMGLQGTSTYLGCATSTVLAHKAAIRQKLRVHSMTAAVAESLRKGWIS